MATRPYEYEVVITTRTVKKVVVLAFNEEEAEELMEAMNEGGRLDEYPAVDSDYSARWECTARPRDFCLDADEHEY